MVYKYEFKLFIIKIIFRLSLHLGWVSVECGPVRQGSFNINCQILMCRIFHNIP